MASLRIFENAFGVKGLKPYRYGEASAKNLELEDEFVMEGLEPFCYEYDEGRSERLAMEEMERQRRLKEEKEQREAEKERRAKAHNKVRDSIIEYDPKVDCKVFTRFFLRDFSIFDIDEKSPILPMRYADEEYRDEFGLEDSVNILSVSIVSSDEGFPVNVYGSVIARDSIDYKCIGVFHRLRDNCQLINLEGGTLDLTGPGRGLVLVDFIYLEIDLKIKEKGVPDKQFSKGLITIDGRVLSREKDVEVRSERLDSFRSTMEVRFATVLNAVEVMFKFKAVEGKFTGKITAGIAEEVTAAAAISDVNETIVIHDSQADGVVKSGEMELCRCVMTICQEHKMLVFDVVNNAGGVKSERTIRFTPQLTGSEGYEFWCGPGKLKVEVVWAMLDFRP